MIDRYSRAEMTAIWSLENKYKTWLDIEILVCEAQAELGVIPKESVDIIKEKADFNIERIDEIEKETHHDVIAFLTSVAEFVGEPARFIHQGITSSDMIDTAFAVCLKQSADILIGDLDRLLVVLERRVKEHKMTPCVGRSHGIHGEPTSFGLKLATHYAAFKRNKARLILARDEIATCAISGAVGTFATIDPFVEQYVADKLGLMVEPISTQIIPRDRHAYFFATLGVVASSIENIAVEIRHLQRTEVREAEEFFAKGQKGSSAMPHKRNPILSENLTGLSRMVRSYVVPAMENVALWHERDISHSSAERMIAPDSTVTLDFALNRLTGMLDKLLVYPETMKNNLNRLNGLVFSQAVLLGLTQNGVSREDAYSIVQRNAMQVWADGSSFLDLLKADKDVSAAINDNDLTALFDEQRYLKHVDTILNRLFVS